MSNFTAKRWKVYVKNSNCEEAKDEIKRLQEYISLAESYEVDSLEKLIIKEYAFTNSIAEIVRTFARRGITKEGNPVEHQDIVKVIQLNIKTL